MKKILLILIFFFSTHVFLFAQVNKNDLQSLTLSNPRKAVDLLNARIESGLQKNDYRNVAPDLLRVASLYRSLGNFDDAMHNLLSAREILVLHASDFSGTDSLMGEYYETMGMIYIGRYMRSRGIELLNKAIPLYIHSGNYEDAATCMKWCTVAFLMDNQPGEARKHVRELYQWQQINRNPFLVACYYESEAAIAEHSGDYENAIKSYKLAMEQYRVCGNIVGQSDMYAYTCRVLLAQEKFDATIEYAENGAQWAREHGDAGGYFEILLYKVFALAKTDVAAAFELAKSQLGEITSLGLTIHKGIYLTNIISYAEKMKQFETAFYYSRQFLEVFKDAYGLSSEQRIADMTMQIQTENLNLRIEKLKTDKDLNERIRNGQRNMIFFFVIALLILLIATIGNLKKLQFRLFLFCDFMSDLLPLPLFFLAFEVYFFILLNLLNNAFINQISGLQLHLHIAALAAIPSIIITLALVKLPAIWSVSPEKNKSFSTVAFITIILLNILVLAYYLSFGIIGWQVFDMLNIVFTYTGLTVVPLFFMVIYIEKVLLRKHIHEAGMMNNRIRKSVNHANASTQTIRIESDKSKDVFESSVSNLLLVEGQSNYTKFYFIDKGSLKAVLLLMTLKQAESQLQNHKEFIRCHKSNIVNLTCVKKVRGNSHGYKLSVPPIEEPVTVSKSYISEFNEAFNRFSSDDTSMYDN